MNQEAIKSSLDGLERKILLLLNERKSFQEQIEKMQDDIQSRDEMISHLKNDIKINEIAHCTSSKRAGVSKLQLKKKIDEYISEIDRCIAYLNV